MITSINTWSPSLPFFVALGLGLDMLNLLVVSIEFFLHTLLSSITAHKCQLVLLTSLSVSKEHYCYECITVLQLCGGGKSLSLFLFINCMLGLNKLWRIKYMTSFIILEMRLVGTNFSTSRPTSESSSKELNLSSRHGPDLTWSLAYLSLTVSPLPSLV